ncbi:hypothetical protein [Planococcus shenhongbingii]|uniref:Uncharacterized protein n=1 Tax=Planococcus shenhongbingii TaxID=3058398 RepID=A0ABT8NE79_9BACL|nr:hypothetical protein [Planococcus sp. N017]MDN7246193.1 hypothetical protein [Planococcus sp. N017]
MEKPISDALQQEKENQSKVELMDQCISSLEGEINGLVICRAIQQAFGMDLYKARILDKELALQAVHLSSPTLPPSAAAIDIYIEQHGQAVSGSEIRAVLNRIFGTNLEGISALHQQRISLYSKDQWIVRNDKDLFLVHTGTNDVDVKVVPTAYFTEKTGMDSLPEDLQQELSNLGFSFDEQVDAYYFCNPNGKAVLDLFKRQTMGAIHRAIQKSYSTL